MSLQKDSTDIGLMQASDSVFLSDSVIVQAEPEEIALLDTVEVVPARPAAYLSGHEPAARPYNAAGDSAVHVVYAVLLILLAFNIKHLRRLLASCAQELVSVRDRDNVFDDRTANESRAAIILALQLCFSAGVLLYFWISGRYDLSTGMSGACQIVVLSCTCAGYYIFQLAGYAVVGYAFAPDANAASRWIKGYTASFAYLSLGIMVPALIALFNPQAASVAVKAAFGLFCLAKLVFVIKGFRIFYYNFWSLLYLILYLCSLEIIPVLTVYSLSLFLLGAGKGFIS